MVNGWKVTAIIFIVLFILQTISFISLIVWGYSLVIADEDREAECSYNICDGATTYYYDEVEQVCQCYVEGILIKSQYMD